MKEFNSLKELIKYYDKESNTIIIKDHVKLNFYLSCNYNITANNIKAGNIDVHDITAHDIDVRNIKAHDIDANNITAHDIKANNIYVRNIDANNIYANNINADNIDADNIDYYVFCIAFKSFKCKSISGRRENSIHKCLDKEIEFKKESVEIIIDGKKIEISKESYEKLKESLNK